MATNLVVNFIGKNNLSKTTAVMSRDLQKFGRLANQVGSGLNKALGVAGVGLGIQQLSRILKNSAKAAVEDGKSQALLANALKNTVGATAGAIRGVEEFVAKTQLSTSILDDELRPALSAAVRATGSLAKGQKLLTTATNVSAGTGLDLLKVTKAIARAQAGQLGGLQRLIPGFKVTTNVITDLDKAYKGSAETAAKNDPYKALSVIFNDIQETIGMALIPALQEFAKYLKTPEGQRNVKQIVGLFVQAGKAVSELTKFVVKNIVMVKALAGFLVTIKLGWMLITGAVKAYEFAVKVATISTKALRVALITTGVGALVVALGFLISGFTEAGDAAEEAQVKMSKKDMKNGETYWAYHARKIHEAYSDSWVARGKAEIKRNTKKVGKAVTDGLWDASKEIAKTGVKFRDSVGLALGTFGKDENSVFNVDVIIEKLKRVVNAAKGFKENLQKLRDQGAGQDVISEIVGMGPAQGNIVAKGLLSSGKLSQYLGLKGQLYNTGIGAGAVMNNTAEKTYSININKANVSAEDIIKAITSYEKKQGKKVFSN